MKEMKEYDRVVQSLNRLIPTLPNRAATVAVNFTKERFRAQNWLDRVAEPWPKRKRKRKGSNNRGAILVKSGRLRRSPRKVTATPEYAIIGIDVEYAQVHNDGGKIEATQHVSSHTRKPHSRKRKGRRYQVAKASVKAHTRKINFTMPQRRFLGQSAALDQRITRMMQEHIVNAITFK